MNKERANNSCHCLSIYPGIEDYPIQFVGMKTEISPVTIMATVLILEASWPACACQDLLENGEMLHFMEQFLQKSFQGFAIHREITLLQKYRKSWLSSVVVLCPRA